MPGDLPLFRNLDAAVQQTRPDWAVVSVPDHAHAGVCSQLLGLGVNVLVEKPLATSVKECRQILDQAKEVGREVRVAHNYRHMRWVLRAEQLVREGRIGRVLAVEAAEILGNPHGAACPSGRTRPVSISRRRRERTGRKGCTLAIPQERGAAPGGVTRLRAVALAAPMSGYAVPCMASTEGTALGMSRAASYDMTRARSMRSAVGIRPSSQRWAERVCMI